MIPPALVAAIADAAPDDPSARLVAADHLQQQHDPAARAHGELITAMVRTPDDHARIESLITAATGEPADRFGWRWGFRERVAATWHRTADRAALADRLAHPTCCVIRGLAIDCPAHAIFVDDVQRAIAPVAPTLRALRVHGYASDDPSEIVPWLDPDVDPDDRDTRYPWPALPQLAELRWDVRTFALASAWPALADVRIAAPTVDHLLSFAAPALTHLRIGRIFVLEERVFSLALPGLPALAYLAFARSNDFPVAQLAALPVTQRLRRLEVVAGLAGERDRRFFPIDRAPRTLDGLLDLGLTPTSRAGAFVKLDDYRGRLELGSTRLEHTGVDWWLRDAPPTTRINGLHLQHVRVVSGDELAADGRIFRAVGSDEDLAALRARTHLYA